MIGIQCTFIYYQLKWYQSLMVCHIIVSSADRAFDWLYRWSIDSGGPSRGSQELHELIAEYIMSQAPEPVREPSILLKNVCCWKLIISVKLSSF